MLVSSSNDSAYAVAASIIPFLKTQQQDTTFIDTMNERALQLGLTKTSFLTTTGLDINNETEPSAYSSARDVSRLFAYIVKQHSSLLESTRENSISRTSLYNKTYYLQNTNPFTDEIPLLIGSKTGLTDIAGGNLVIAFDAGLMHPIVIVILGSSSEGRFTDMKILIDATLAYISYDA